MMNLILADLEGLSGFLTQQIKELSEEELLCIKLIDFGNAVRKYYSEDWLQKKVEEFLASEHKTFEGQAKVKVNRHGQDSNSGKCDICIKYSDSVFLVIELKLEPKSRVFKDAELVSKALMTNYLPFEHADANPFTHLQFCVAWGEKDDSRLLIRKNEVFTYDTTPLSLLQEALTQAGKYARSIATNGFRFDPDNFGIIDEAKHVFAVGLIVTSMFVRRSEIKNFIYDKESGECIERSPSEYEAYLDQLKIKKKKDKKNKGKKPKKKSSR